MDFRAARRITACLTQKGATRQQAKLYVDLVRRFINLSNGQGDEHHVLPKGCGWKQYETRPWNLAVVRRGFHVALHATLADIFPHDLNLRKALRVITSKLDLVYGLYELESQIIDMVQNGLMDVQIAKKLKVSSETVRKCRVRHGLPTQYELKRRKLASDGIILIKQGLSDAEIERRLGVHHHTVLKFRQQRGIPSQKQLFQKRFKEQVPLLVKQGLNDEQIAQKLKTDHHMIGEWRHQRNIPSQQEKLKEKGLSLIKSGLTASEAAKKLGIPYQTVYRWVR